jgi:serralysin
MWSTGGAGNDLLYGGDSLLFTASHREDYYPTTPDLSDTILGGDGHDTINGGYGNDLAYGGTGDDILNGDQGGDTLIGQAGNDSLSGNALGDMLFGGDGDDYLNGGVGYDRLNGGMGADRFYHQGNWDHGSDWVQDYSAADGDVLQLGAIVPSDRFQVNFARTPGAGDAGTDEAFVIYRPSGQILWALVDGSAQDSIHLMIAGVEYDLLA